MMENRDRVTNLDNSMVLQNYFKRGTVTNKIIQS
jgi:hypothetical protein